MTAVEKGLYHSARQRPRSALDRGYRVSWQQKKFGPGREADVAASSWMG